MLWDPLEFHTAIVERAWHWTDDAGLNYWDALILAAAEAAGCRYLLSEDFQEGRRYGAVEVINPFRTGPENFFT
jgi:predicted nucleic acid-binding protein